MSNELNCVSHGKLTSVSMLVTSENRWGVTHLVHCCPPIVLIDGDRTCSFLSDNTVKVWNIVDCVFNLRLSFNDAIILQWQYSEPS